MLTHLIILLLIVVILDLKVKINIEKRLGQGPVRSRAGPPPGDSLPPPRQTTGLARTRVSCDTVTPECRNGTGHETRGAGQRRPGCEDP